MVTSGARAPGALPQASNPFGPLLRVSGVSKTYGPTRALDDVGLDIDRGEVHSLVGANGAGKSTLIKILAGLEHSDTGIVEIDGKPQEIADPSTAHALGFSFIHQELNLVPKFSVLQNMAMGYELPVRRGLVSWRSVERRATEVLRMLGAGLPLRAEAESLTVSDRWMVSLGRSLMRSARLIAMDEPTASFTEEESEKLFEIIRRLTGEGVAVLYISHRLDEVLDLSDRITVFRNGRVVDRFQRGEVDKSELTEAIVGREVLAVERSAEHREGGEPQLVLTGVTAGSRVRGVDLEVRRGEILGIAGLVGSGRTELARLLAGVDRLGAGEMTLGGRRFAPRSPHEAIAAGVALVPEERRSEALVLEESIQFNANLATLRSNRLVSALPWLSMKKAKKAAQEVIEQFGVKAESPGQVVGRLSGGNQQKVVVGRFVRSRPKVLILDEPTVGVDVGARAEIYLIIRRLTEAGASVVLISSDFDELAICDRVAVMREGRITAVLESADASKDQLTRLCYATGEER